MLHRYSFCNNLEFVVTKLTPVDELISGTLTKNSARRAAHRPLRMKETPMGGCCWVSRKLHPTK